MITPSHAVLASTLAFAALTGILPAHASIGTEPPPPPAAMPANSDAMEQFRAALAPYGSFQTHPRYGEVWTPAAHVIPPGWKPYPECRWVYDTRQRQWVYDDPTPWGQVVHRHGRWASEGGAWLWVAEGIHGPGWVAWHADGQTVRWAALTPEIDGLSQPPAEHWHGQDAQRFNSGCRPSAAPPAPMAFAPRAPIVAQAAPPVRMVHVAPPVIVAPPPPIIVRDPRPTIIVDPRPPRPDCRVIYPRPHWCHPRPRPGPRGVATDPRPLPVNPGWGTVRDHRRPGPVIVRDHRRPGGPVIVRDHRRPGGPVIVRPNRPPGGVVVTRRPIVRDHRV